MHCAVRLRHYCMSVRLMARLLWVLMLYHMLIVCFQALYIYVYIHTIHYC